MIDNEIWTSVAIISATFALLIGSIVYMDKRQERFMAEKGYCYQSVDRAGTQPNWQYQTCK